MERPKRNILILIGATAAIALWAYFYRCAIPRWWIILILVILTAYGYIVWKNKTSVNKVN